MKVKTDKNETLRRLGHAVFELEAGKGHLGWKVSDLARKAKLSRSLIYRYLGSSKNEILMSALEYFINDFYGFQAGTNSTSLAEQIRLARQRMILYPEAILFYQKWRSKSSKLQKEFIDIEARFQRDLKKAFPTLSDREILAKHALIHGLVTAPFLSADQAAQIYSDIYP